MNKTLFNITMLCGALAVGIGAFGAHGLKAMIAADQLQTFETGVKYQFYHTFAMCFALIFTHIYKDKRFQTAAWLFFVGILMFSGSLYILACRDILPFDARFVGPITPLGGAFFIAGWMYMAWVSSKKGLIDEK
jgi:uncharacterized membrane protein YgdD (TMEM256/DUF423 family)